MVGSQLIISNALWESDKSFNREGKELLPVFPALLFPRKRNDWSDCLDLANWVCHIYWYEVKSLYLCLSHTHTYTHPPLFFNSLLLRSSGYVKAESASLEQHPGLCLSSAGCCELYSSDCLRVSCQRQCRERLVGIQGKRRPVFGSQAPESPVLEHGKLARRTGTIQGFWLRFFQLSLSWCRVLSGISGRGTIRWRQIWEFPCYPGRKNIKDQQNLSLSPKIKAVFLFYSQKNTHRHIHITFCIPLQRVTESLKLKGFAAFRLGISGIGWEEMRTQNRIL